MIAIMLRMEWADRVTVHSPASWRRRRRTSWRDSRLTKHVRIGGSEDWALRTVECAENLQPHSAMSPVRVDRQRGSRPIGGL